MTKNNPREDMVDGSAALVYKLSKKIFFVVEILDKKMQNAQAMINLIGGVKIKLNKNIILGIGYQQPITTIGYDYRKNKTLPLANKPNSKDNRRVSDAGFYYLLPMLIRSEWRIDRTGRLRLQLERRDLPLSNNFFFNFRANTDKEYNVAARYMMAKSFSISTNYDSDYKWGISLTWHYELKKINFLNKQ